MDFIDKFSNIISLPELKKIIQIEYQCAYDFFLVQSHSSINKQNTRIEEVISSKLSFVQKLDFSDIANRNFITILTLACERIGAFSLFEILYKLSVKSNTNISYRLQAVSLYTIGIRCFEDYVKVFDEILFKLNNAFEKEEDNIEVVVAAFIQYYAKIVNNFGRFNQQGVLRIKERISLTRDGNFLLQHPIIDEILEINTSDFKTAFEQIQLILDKFLNRTSVQTIVLKDECLIESTSEYDYASVLSKTKKTFISIRSVSVSIWKRINDKQIVDSLGRGTSILTDEAQLYAYFNSFGNSHYAKMLCSLNCITWKDLNNAVEVFDWGCGQGLASIVFLENSKGIKVTNVTLIEPSEIALKRASLHIKHMNNAISIKTVCKRLDLLNKNDVLSETNKIKIHLFSNILDVNGFSMTNLMELIEQTQKMINYFICVSPYIDDVKSERVNSFNQYFKNKYNGNYTFLFEATNSKFDDEYWNCNNKYNDNFDGRFCYQPHPESGCKEKWTRVIRVFKVDFSN